MATIRIDDELKKEADEMFDEVGMNTSVVKTGKFPFEIETIDHQPNEETLKAFKETDEMINQGNLGNNEELQAYFDRMKKEADLDA